MKRSAPLIVAAVLGALLVGLLMYGVIQQGSDASLDDAVRRGERPTAPDRRLPALDGGGQLSLADFRGKVVVLNFWASWCIPCREEAPLLQAAHRRLSRDGSGTVFGVTYQDAPADSRAFLKEFGITYPIARDIDTRLAREYGTRALPETFVIDRNGGIVSVSRGKISQRFLDRALDQALRR